MIFIYDSLEFSLVVNFLLARSSAQEPCTAAARRRRRVQGERARSGSRTRSGGPLAAPPPRALRTFPVAVAPPPPSFSPHLYTSASSHAASESQLALKTS
ncbi:hypothetical protein EVAR_26607_1 [Eumeta japonica]|uniref:Uncharacterized protein n=1 Tax=Eumeta variegata TaxID=151549 RepID=A0A4C1XJE3_EUMVA|nr:hypothetical protein EVAR_26607_1 [Eumeta japonica]